MMDIMDCPSGPVFSHHVQHGGVVYQRPVSQRINTPGTAEDGGCTCGVCRPICGDGGLAGG